MNCQQIITKINKTSEILFNTTSIISVGLQISEFLGIKNNHFLQIINTLTSKKSSEELKQNEESGKIGGDKEV
jgi:hypothetical protein